MTYIILFMTFYGLLDPEDVLISLILKSLITNRRKYDQTRNY